MCVVEWTFQENWIKTIQTMVFLFATTVITHISYFLREGGESAPSNNLMDFWPATGGKIILEILRKALNLVALQWNYSSPSKTQKQQLLPRINTTLQKKIFDWLICFFTQKFFIFCKSRVFAVACSPAFSHLVATTSDDRTIRINDMNTNESWVTNRFDRIPLIWLFWLK
jgi:WD40 repeat protein